MAMFSLQEDGACWRRLCSCHDGRQPDFLVASVYLTLGLGVHRKRAFQCQQLRQVLCGWPADAEHSPSC